LKFFLSIILSGLILVSGCTGINLSRAIIPDSEDWIMAGGSPEQQNIAKSVLNPPLELVWSYNLDAGIGYSAFAVSDEVLFVNNLQGEMYGLDISSGGKVGHINFLGKDASTTPLVLGNEVIVTFAGDNKYSIASYNMLGAEINWRKRLGDIQTSPVLKDDFIYTGNLGGKFYKLDRNGKIIWFFKAGSPIHSTCAVAGGKVVFGSDKGKIFCLSTDDGSKLWEYKTNAPVFCTPLAFEDKIFIGSDDSNYICLDINSGNKIWSQNMKTKIFSGSALFNSDAVVFGGVNGNLYSLNVKDGSVNWTFRSYGVITGSPVVSGSNIYFASYDRNIYCVNGSNGGKLWSYEMEGKGKTSPVIWKNFLFAADDQNVICFTHMKNAE
jgi:eukaryotic-like serine/threonine-protein kinase